MEMSVCPTLWSRLKYFNTIRWIGNFYTHGPREKFFGDPPTSSTVTMRLTFIVQRKKYLDSYLMQCHKICYTYSRSMEGWIQVTGEWWSSEFPSHSTNISTLTWCIDTNLCADIHTFQTMNSNDFGDPQSFSLINIFDFYLNSLTTTGYIKKS